MRRPGCNATVIEPLPALEVFFDGRCPLCAREMAHYIRANRSDLLRFTDLWREPERLAAAGLEHTAAMARLHAHLAGTGLLCGVPVFFAIWRRLPGWRWLSRLLAPLEEARWVAGLYEAFARRRLRQRCAEGACAAADHHQRPPLA